MFLLPELPYEYSALEPFIDTETMQIHHDKHHAAYVKNVNDALIGHDDLLSMDPIELYKNLDKVPEDIRVKVKNNLGGHINHTLFWQVMSPDVGKTPGEELKEKIDSTFGSFEAFKEKFAAAGLGRFGSGWVWLVVTRNKDKSDESTPEIISTPNQDNPILEGKTPILGLDVWEHAYYLKYKNMRADYINAWWNVVNWDEVENLFDKSSK